MFRNLHFRDNSKYLNPNIAMEIKCGQEWNNNH
jgi:hypothetical protein